jgi:plasmid stability protein
MATLMIRDLDDDVKARLRVQAAEHGRSMEAEAREILARAVQGPRPARGLATFLRTRLADLGGGLELEVPPRTEVARGTDLTS